MNYSIAPRLLENWLQEQYCRSEEHFTLWRNRLLLITTTQTHFNVVKFTQFFFSKVPKKKEGSFTQEFVAPIDREIWSLKLHFQVQVYRLCSTLTLFMTILYTRGRFINTYFQKKEKSFHFDANFSENLKSQFQLEQHCRRPLAAISGCIETKVSLLKENKRSSWSSNCEHQ